MSFGRKAAERLANRSILITGASSGIGEACAKVFAEASNGQIKLILGARRKERLIKLSDTLIKQYPNIKIHHDFLDVTIKDSISKFIAGIPTDFEPDVLINNSGKALGKEQVGELKDEDITEMLDTNVVGVIRMTQAVLPLLKKKNYADVVFIGNIAGRVAYKNGGGYCASKAAVRSFVDTFRKETIDTGIRVIEVDPGAVLTEFSVVRYKGDTEAADAVYTGTEPLTPEDVAEVVVFAASRKQNTVIADTLIFPNHQASPDHVYRKPN